MRRRLHPQRLAWAAMVSIGLLSNVTAQSLDTPMTRLRPIGEPSAVDRWIRPDGQPQVPVTPAVVRAEWETSAGLPDSQMRQSPMSAEGQSPTGNYTVRAQFQMPGGPTMAPPSDSSIIPPPSLGTMQPSTGGTVLGPSSPPLPPTFSPQPTTTPQNLPVAPAVPPSRSLPTSPAPMTMAPMTTAPRTLAPTSPGSSDLLPLAPPQLHDHFATIDNCSCVSPPSSYVAATGWTQCAPTTTYASAPAPSTYIGTPAAVTTTVPAPAVAAPVIPAASSMPAGSGVPRHSLISFGQNRNPIVVGQGIVGQPVAYVPGQWFRNWIRYVFP